MKVNIVKKLILSGPIIIGIVAICVVGQLSCRKAELDKQSQGDAPRQANAQRPVIAREVGTQQEVGTQREVTVESYFEALHDWKSSWSAYTSYFVWKKEYALAVQKCDEALQKFPDDKEFVWEIFITKQMALREAGLYDEEIKGLNIWYDRFKDDQTVMRYGKTRSYKIKQVLAAHLARIYEEQGKYAAAIAQYQKGIDMVTQDMLDRYPIHFGRGRLVAKKISGPMSIGNCYRKLGKYELALEQYRKALAYAKEKDAFAYGSTEDIDETVVENRRSYRLSELTKWIAECEEKM